jgi:amphi-Trp domain-containing protein
MSEGRDGSVMSEETIHESTPARGRRAIASYLRRLAEAFDGDGPVPVDEDGTVTVDPPADASLEVEVEREEGETSLELEAEWPEGEGGVDAEADVGSAATFELYRDNADEWRWRLRHDNGNVIADGGEGYASKQNAKKGIASVRKNAPGAATDEID